MRRGQQQRPALAQQVQLARVKREIAGKSPDAKGMPPYRSLAGLGLHFLRRHGVSFQCEEEHLLQNALPAGRNVLA